MPAATPSDEIEELLTFQTDDVISATTGFTLEEIVGLRAMKAAGALRTDTHWREAVSQLKRQ